MDPDVALREYRRALLFGDTKEAAVWLKALQEWKNAGGFAPVEGWPAVIRDEE